MSAHYPIVFETENNGDVSAYVAGLPIYAQAASHRDVERAIRSMLVSYFEKNPVPTAIPRIKVARVEAAAPKSPKRLGRSGKTSITMLSAAALIGARTSPRKAASSRANGRLGGRPRKHATARG